MADAFPPPPISEEDVVKVSETEEEMRDRMAAEGTLMRICDSEWTAAIKAAAMFNQQMAIERRLRGPFFRDPHSNSIQHLDTFCVNSVSPISDQQRISRRTEEIEKMRYFLEREFGMDWKDIMEMSQPNVVELKNWARELSQSETDFSILDDETSSSIGSALSPLSSVSSPPPPSSSSSSSQTPSRSSRSRDRPSSSSSSSSSSDTPQTKEGRSKSSSSSGSTSSTSTAASASLITSPTSPPARSKSSRSSSAASSPPEFPMDVCQVCGDRESDCPASELEGTKHFEALDEDPLLKCVQCKRLFHAIHCLQMPRETLETIRKRTQEQKTQKGGSSSSSSSSSLKGLQLNWTCVECKACATCLDATHDDKLLFCDQCDQGFHTFCLQTPLRKPPPGRWICESCVHCRACGSLSPGSGWKHGYSLCSTCNKLLHQSLECPVCQRRLPSSDKEVQSVELIKCKQCNWIVHADCEKLPRMTEKQRGQYLCSLCRKSNRTGQPTKHTPHPDPSSSDDDTADELEESTPPPSSRRSSRSRPSSSSSSSVPPRKRHRQ